MASTLEHLLRRIRDRVATSEEVASARGLVVSDDRLPDELRSIVLLDEAEMPSDAAGLLAVLGCDDLGEILAEAIHAEASSSSPDPPELEAQERDASWRLIAEHLAGGLRRVAASEEVVDGVLKRLPTLHGWIWGPVLAEAVRRDAGQVDVVPHVLSSLALSTVDVPVAAAVRGEAGQVDVVTPVMETLGLSEVAVPVAEAIRAEAGRVAVAEAVLSELGLSARMPPALAPPPASIAPANNNRFWGRVALALAAALVATVLGSSLIGGSSLSESPLVFAHAEDVVIEDLDFGDGASGMVDASSEDGTLILWVDEE